MRLSKSIQLVDYHFVVKLCFPTGKKNLQDLALHELTFCSGIFLLQDQRWQGARVNCTRAAYSHMFPETKRALEVLGRLSSALRKDLESGGPLEEGLPIFFMQTLYQATTVAMEIGQGHPEKEIQEKIDAFKWLLQHFRSRWKLAGKFC